MGWDVDIDLYYKYFLKQCFTNRLTYLCLSVEKGPKCSCQTGQAADGSLRLHQAVTHVHCR